MMLHDSVIKRTTCVVSLVTIIAGYTNDAESYDVVMDISENYIEHLADMIGREASVRVCVDGEGDSMTLRWREFYRALCRHVRF